MFRTRYLLSYQCTLDLDYLLTIGNEPDRISEVTVKLSKKGEWRGRGFEVIHIRIRHLPFECEDPFCSISRKGLQSETDLFIVRVILQLLASDLDLEEKVKLAQQTLASFLKESSFGIV